MKRLILLLLCSSSIVIINLSFKEEAIERPDFVEANLSEYGFFSGDLKELRPSQGVIPYDLNTPLFSDYAHKLRFVKLPEGQTAAYTPMEVLDFPAGTYFIKNFY